MLFRKGYRTTPWLGLLVLLALSIVGHLLDRGGRGRRRVQTVDLVVKRAGKGAPGKVRHEQVAGERVDPVERYTGCRDRAGEGQNFHHALQKKKTERNERVHREPGPANLPI